MKITYSTVKASVGGWLVFALATAAWAAPPAMKMARPVLPGIVTPDSLETRLGTLTSVDGVPDAATAQKVYDDLDLQRAVQAHLNTIQIASMDGMRKGILKFGPKAPAGKESNWIQTAPGKGWNMLWRIYGPTEPWYDKTWRIGDPTLVP